VQNDNFVWKTTRRAVLVGVNQYAYLNQLSGCVPDLMAMDQLCQSCAIQTHTLTDKAATRQNILNAVRGAMSDGKCTEFIFLFSGHGGNANSQQFLCPVEFQGDSDALLKNWVVSALNGKALKTAVLLLDCCRSGAAMTTTNVQTTFSLLEWPLGVSYAVVYACDEFKTAPDANDGGLLTQSVVKALGQGRVSFGQAIGIAQRTVRTFSPYYRLWIEACDDLNDYYLAPAAPAPGSPTTDAAETD